MKKLITVLTLSCMTPIAIAGIPNVWGSGSLQGWSEYSISDTQGQVLSVSCNFFDITGEPNPQYGVRLDLKNKTLDTDELAFLIDGEARYPSTASTRSGEQAWYDFVVSISKGKVIDVYHQRKKVATFKPTIQSIKKEASGIELSCIFN